MGLLGWIRGGSDELGWDDLVRRVVEAVAKLARYGEHGRVAFPPDVEVQIGVAEGSVEVIRGFVDKPELDQAVGAALANRCDCDARSLPSRQYLVAAAAQTSVVAVEGAPRVWELEIGGGDLDGRVLAIPAGRKEVRLGRGEWHGTDATTRNDLVVCEETDFVSRRAARITFAGHHPEIESLDQGDTLTVRRAGGDAIRPARTARGRAALEAGDTIELGDGRARVVRLVLRRRVADPG